MASYIITLIAVSTVLGALCLLAPAGGRRNVRLCATLCLLAVMLAPLSRLTRALISASEGGAFIGTIFLPDGSAESDYASAFEQALLAADEARIAAALRSELIKRSETDAEGLAVSCTLCEANGALYISGVTVRLSGGAILCDPEVIREYIRSVTECECEIIYY